MKRFRRHGHESHRDKLKQELFQFNKASKIRDVIRKCHIFIMKLDKFVKSRNQEPSTSPPRTELPPPLKIELTVLNTLKSNIFYNFVLRAPQHLRVKLSYVV